MPDSPAVLVLYNLPRSGPVGLVANAPRPTLQESSVAQPPSAANLAAATAFSESDAGILEEVRAVCEALARLKIPHRAAGVSSLADVPSAVAAGTEPVVFNLVESLAGDPQDCNLVPAICRTFGRSCTGNDDRALAISLDKWQSKALLQAAGLLVPKAICVCPGQKLRRTGLFAGPYIVKPACADASEGITAESVVRSAGAALAKAVRRIHELGQAALVEQYIVGRELNVSVLQTGSTAGDVQVLPLAEIDFSALPKDADKPRIVDYSAKWLTDSFAFHNTPRVIPAPLPPAVAKQVRQAALAAWHVLGCRDYVRVDFRLDSKLRPLILEVNANPDISPDAGFAAAVQAAGIGFDGFVETVVANAAARLEEVRQHTRHARAIHADAQQSAPADPQECTIRPTRASDREPIVQMLTATAFFRPDEVAVAEEVLDEAIAKGDAGHYQSYAICQADRPLGWVCFGATWCCLGTFDLYWIVVDPTVQARGLGKALVWHTEKLVRAMNGRVIVIETSGRDVYLPTRRFYLRCGYHEAARIADFYADGDDKVVYIKHLRDWPEN